MNHRAPKSFWQLYDKLEPEVQSQADRQFELLKQNSRHPSLHFKQVGKGRYWSARVNKNHRALAIQKGDTLVWFWIGSHDNYTKIINS